MASRLGRLFRVKVVVIAASGMLGASGCSFIFVQGPPPPGANPVRATCTTGRAAPIVDTIVAITQGFRIAIAAFDEEEYERLGIKTTRGKDIAISGALLGLFAGSAIFGYTRVSDCRQAEAEWALYAEQHRDEQLRQLRRRQASMAPGGASPAEPAAVGGGRSPEDELIAAAFGGKVVRACWLKPPSGAGATPPCLLKGDFDGDGRPDAAVLVAEVAEPMRKGIALLTSDAERALLGAGNAVGNGGDDFAWMDAWRVVTKAEATRLLGRAAGDGLVVEKTESAGGLIGIVAGRPQWAQASD